MAYDGYRQSPGPYDQTANPPQPTSPTDSHFSTSTPPYPSNYGPDRINMPRPQMPPAPQGQPPNPDPAWQQQPQTGRINEAVNSAYSQADTPSYLPPEVLSTITANVIQQLKATGLDNLQGQPPPPHPPSQFQPQPQQQWPPASGPVPYSEAPPPPGMAAQNPWSAQPPSQYQAPPPQQPWPPGSGPMPPYGETQPMTGQNQGPVQPPNLFTEHTDTQPYQTPAGYATSPRPGSKSSSVAQPETQASPFHQGYPTSQGSEYNQTGEARPRAPSRNSTVTETTTLEKIWGSFFDHGKPTDRLGQFLRGIAVHLIEDYPPGNTIVIVPEKMQRFYEDTRVEPDPYPWQDIFDDRTSSISRLFRDVEAEHHLVQEKPHLRPDIPGLTPNGFQRWATLMIQAHPEREYERLQKAVLNMPISNPDNKRERFPKEIPQRLFPEVPNLAQRERIDESIMKHCHLELPPITDEEIAKAAHPPRSSKGPTKTHGERRHGESSPSAHERGRQPYNTSTSAVVDDEEEQLSPHPLERARKPYSAQPGGGKAYDEAGASRRHTGSLSTSPRPKEDFLSSSPKHRLSDVYNQEPPYTRASGSGAHRFTKNPRSRSSSRGMNGRRDYRNSEGELIDRDGRYPGMPPTGEYYYDPAKSNHPGDHGEDSRRYRDLDLDAEDKRFHDSVRERERSKYQERLHRPSWADEEEYYRGGR